MAKKAFLFKTILFALFSFYNIFINVSAQAIQPQGRFSPGCALVQTKIYCYGGLTKYQVNSYGPYYSAPLNEHITLDLNPIGNLSQFNQSSIQWKSVSNTYNGIALPNIGSSAAVSLTDNTYLLYGGAASTLGGDPNLTYPFLHYNPQSDAWNNLPLLPNGTYSTRTQIVNVGGDAIWIWGGGLNSSGFGYTYDYGVFNYKSASWSNMQINSGAVRMDHTVTLSSNGLIYIMGGYFKANATEIFYISDFSRIYTYDTKSLNWGNIVATGQIPSDRGLHTTTPSPDRKSFYIYGGAQMLSTGLSVATDVFYIYDCYSNSFKSVNLPKNTLSTNNNNGRFGHFADLYNSTYLVMSFGFNDASTPAESLSVLNVADPNNPVWSIGPPGTQNDDQSGGSGTDPKILIPAIVVPVVVVLLGAAIGLFFFMRHRKRERQNAFVLEQEDPRKRDTNPLDFTDLTTDTATTEANSNSLGRKSVDITKPFMMEYSNQHATNTVNSNQSHLTNSTLLQQQSNMNRVDLNETDPIKPFESGV